MDEPRRDDVFDRELRRALAAGGGAPASPHVDAELAAAWMDRRLDASATRSIDEHLAGCSDCQAIVATLARLSPDVPAAGEGSAWWRRLRAGWLVPATVAAAAALVIWVAVPQQRATTTEPERATAAPAPATVAPPVTPQEADAPAASRRFATPVSEPEGKALKLEQAAPASPAPPPPAVSAPSSALERREQVADAAAPAQPEARKENSVVEAQTPVLDAQRADKVTVRGESPAPAAPPARQEAASRAFGRLNETVTLSAVARARALAVVATDGTGRWRRTAAAIEYAPAATAPFRAASLPVDADTLVAGAAPGGSVCWLVGSAGTVLVTTDGVRFTRVTVPAAVDLTGVAATDARTATVTAADGRRFRTTDAGATWTPQ